VPRVGILCHQLQDILCCGRKGNKKIWKVTWINCIRKCYQQRSHKNDPGSIQPQKYKTPLYEDLLEFEQQQKAAKVMVLFMQLSSYYRSRLDHRDEVAYSRYTSHLKDLDSYLKSAFMKWFAPGMLELPPMKRRHLSLNSLLPRKLCIQWKF
jgi:hypothetical protein